jgi:hypothetical protein
VKIRIYRTFRYQLGLVAVLWPILFMLHVHWSGYGLTAYLWWMDWLRSVMANVPGMNAYNVPADCGLALCGYPLTNLMHGMALMLIGLTVDLVFESLSLGWVGLLSYGITTGIAVLWEKYELLRGITILRPEAFPTVQAAVFEAKRLLNDTVDDILWGLAFLCLTFIALLIADHHFGYEYVNLG